jgi:uncharacterized lipoprotein YajG
MKPRLFTVVLILLAMDGLLMMAGCGQSPSETEVVDPEVQVQTRVAQTLVCHGGKRCR